MRMCNDPIEGSAHVSHQQTLRVQDGDSVAWSKSDSNEYTIEWFLVTTAKDEHEHKCLGSHTMKLAGGREVRLTNFILELLREKHTGDSNAQRRLATQADSIVDDT